MRRLFILWCALMLALGAEQPTHAATGDVLSATVLSNGRELDITFAGMGTGGTYATGLAGHNHCLTGLEKCRLLVTSHSWTNAGVATTIQRVLIGQWPRRKQYPNQATNEESFSGGNTTVRVVLSDYVYAEDNTGAGNSGVSVKLDMGSGFYTKDGTPNNPASNLTVTNSSTAAFQPVGAYWTMVSRVLVHDTFTLSLAAFHRHWGQWRPVRCVKFTVSDQHSHTVTVFAEDLSKTWNYEQKPVQEYVASIPVTSFTEGDTLTCQADVHPWVGDNILTTVGGTAEPYAGFGPRTFVLDKANDYGKTCALVDVVNGIDPASPDATKVYDESVFNPATAYKFQTRGRAYASVVAYNLANHARNDGGAAKIYSLAGSYPMMGSTNASYGNQPAVRPEFLPAPGVTTAEVIINGEVGSQDIGDLITETATITSTTAGTYGGINDVYFKDAIINTSNTQLFATANSILSMTGGKVQQMGQGLQATSTVNFAVAMLRGVDLSGFGGTIRPYCMIGCAGTSCGNLRIVDESNGQASPFLAPLFAFNEFLGITNGAGADVVRLGVISNSVPGFFDVGNCFETITGPGAGGFVSLYTGEFHYVGGVRFCGTVVGSREFDRYNDGQSPANQSDSWSREFGVDAFCYRDRPATKMDLLPPQDGGRQGCAASLFGTSYHCNYYCQNMWSLSGRSFYKEHGGLGSWQPNASDTPDYGGTEALFTRRMASIVRSPGDPANGLGNGSYVPQPNSPLVGMPERSGIPCPLRWDLKGRDRAILNAVGAYVPEPAAFRDPAHAARMRALN